jgi:hypothetical protein
MVNIPMMFHERNKKKNLNPPFFISMATVAKFVLLILILLAYLIPLDVDVQETLLQKIVKIGANLTFFAPWLPWQRLPF